MVSYLRINNLSSVSNPSTITLFCLIISTLQLLVNSYTPSEDFLIDSGSAGKSKPDSDGRVWMGDIGSKYVSLIEPQVHRPSVAADSPQKNSGSGNLVPHLSARLSYSEFTYSLSVTGGPKFVRLHFYPASYPDFIRSKSLFSVKEGRSALLKDFNASVVADNDNNPHKVVFMEYCVNVEPGQRLNITFIPSLSNPDSYAFINGIEVMSLPPYLYKPDVLGIKFVGENSEYGIDMKKTLETAYRINVGGPMIQPGEDTGLFRFWEDDARYLKKQQQSDANVSVGLGDVKPRYTDQVPNFTAPVKVYLTARSFGMMNESSKVDNLSWDFEVDSSFTYLVRLHFCEFESRIQKAGDRVFQIFIADNLAEDDADVIKWSGGSLVPVYKDYAVGMPRRLRKSNLSIKLQPHPDKMMSVFHDVILNGIEIFKVGDNLGEPNKINDGSSSSFTSEKLEERRENSDPKKTTIIQPVIGAAVSVVTLVCVIGFCYFRRRRIIKAKVKTEMEAEMISIAGSKVSLPPPDVCRNFSIIDIRLATINFDNIFIVGVGGFGNVYKGFIDDGTTPVAIKRYNPNLSGQGAPEFQTEIEMLTQISHPHLVSLIGFCNDENEMILVYDFMARGTLRDHLYGSKKTPLSWKQRLEACLGAARGLRYLHYGAKRNVIHRDVKTTNILLDDKWVAKISDFGLSKFGPNGVSKTHITTLVKGSIGYLDPQYYKSQRLTQKSDVYSFGVVLLEVLCGRPPLLRAVEKPKANIVEWVEKCHGAGLIDQVVDPFLKGRIEGGCLDKYVELALSCTFHDGNQRPAMRNVVEGLKFVLQLQERKEDMMSGGTQDEGTSEGVCSQMPC